MSGNVLINENADRVNSYTVWDYAEGQDSYQNSMLVDLTQPPDKVNDWLVGLVYDTERYDTDMIWYDYDMMDYINVRPKADEKSA